MVTCNDHFNNFMPLVGQERQEWYEEQGQGQIPNDLMTRLHQMPTNNRNDVPGRGSRLSR
ncbi:protein of unknown function [Burkholderia multivorans]